MAVTDPCALLNRLIRETAESEWLEFKASNADVQEIGEYIAALANAAMLADRDRAYLVFGIENGTRQKIGTSVRLRALTKGGENFINWVSRLVEPRLMLEFLDFSCDGLNFAIVCIEPTYDRPVRFSGVEYLRIGENKKKLADFPDHERALWLATGRRKFEHAIALPNQTTEEVLAKLDAATFYKLSGEPEIDNDNEIVRGFVSAGFLRDNMQGRFDITNLGAILLARDITSFPSIATKSVRVIRYVGTDKSKSDLEQEGKKGYAVGFSSMIKFLMGRIPNEEKYIDGVRRLVPIYPETAIREVIANALIHQDFTVSGSAPVVEIYSNRIEVTNPGNSLIDTDRILDERRSRNEKLASTMRQFGLCEERGGGLDKTMLELEQLGLPAPEFNSSHNSMRVVLFGPKPFNEMSKEEKQRGAFYHCVLRWLKHDYMSNSSLRERFSLPDEEYQAVSAIIAEAIKDGKIVPADPNQGRRNAKYIPYWAKK